MTGGEERARYEPGTSPYHFTGGDVFDRTTTHSPDVMQVYN